MKNSFHVAIVIAAVALSTLLLDPATGRAQTPAPAPADQSQVGRLVLDEKAKAARAKRLAEAFDRNARVLTLFDRQGNIVATVGERAIYGQPNFSPDRTRLAVMKTDMEAETTDIWVLDVATGKSTRITASQTGAFAGSPVWSPDGRELAYVALRGSYQSLYRKASNGEGTEALVYQHPGQIVVTDWSMDGRFLSFFSRDLTGGILYALPITGDGERKPIEMFRTASQAAGPRLSPDSRFVSYASDESGKDEVHVRPFDPSAGASALPVAGSWQVSDQGSRGMLFWRQDGKEMYYFAADGGVMAVPVSTAPTFEFGKPTMLFRLSQAVPVNPATASVSSDGQRIVLAVHPKPTLLQITVFNRRGTVVSKVGEPGRYVNPALSPDGTKVAVIRTDPRTSIQDVWTYDVASGQGAAVTNDPTPENAPIWAPDGRHVAYASTRRGFAGIYRKAWDGTGQEEQLFQYTPGAGLVLTDWSADGKFVTFHDGCSGVLHILPVSGDRSGLERKAIEWLRDEYEVAQARFSPDSRFIAYLSNEIDADTFQVYVRPFDAAKPEVDASSATPVQVSTAGALGMIFWRTDGKELYFMTPQWQVMAMDVTTTPTFKAGAPRLLFTLPGPLVGNPQQWRNVSRDGQRFVFAINVPASVTVR